MTELSFLFPAAQHISVLELRDAFGDLLTDLRAVDSFVVFLADTARSFVGAEKRTGRTELPDLVLELSYPSIRFSAAH
jgi:hypothetical protein